MITLPKGQAVRAGKRKQHLKDLLPNPVGLLYIANDDGTIIWEEEFPYDPLDEEGFDIICSFYTRDVYEYIREPDLAWIGELRNWQQPREGFRIGTVVFDVAGMRGYPGCFGTVKMVSRNTVYVHWNDSNKIVPCDKSEVRVVPMINTEPPRTGGGLAIVCGGANPEYYGKVVRVCDSFLGMEDYIFVSDAVGNIMCMHTVFLHAVSHTQEEIRIYRDEECTMVLRERNVPPIGDATFNKHLF